MIEGAKWAGVVIVIVISGRRQTGRRSALSAVVVGRRWPQLAGTLWRRRVMAAVVVVIIEISFDSQPQIESFIQIPSGHLARRAICILLRALGAQMKPTKPSQANETYRPL